MTRKPSGVHSFILAFPIKPVRFLRRIPRLTPTAAATSAGAGAATTTPTSMSGPTQHQQQLHIGPGGHGIVAIGGVDSTGALASAALFLNDIVVDGCVVSDSGGLLQTFGTCSSDIRLKKNIEAFPTVLDKVSQLQPVTYSWRTDEYPQFRFSSGKAVGLIAQEVEKIFPDMVSTDQAGYKRVNYGALPYLMLQAIRELKAGNDQLRAENDNLRERIQRLEAAATRTL